MFDALCQISEDGNTVTDRDHEQIFSDTVPYVEPKNNFIFETHNSDIKLQTVLALLLAHAVQRRSQSDMLSVIDASSQ